jgi:hypothetical protein
MSSRLERRGAGIAPGFGGSQQNLVARRARRSLISINTGIHGPKSERRI